MQIISRTSWIRWISKICWTHLTNLIRLLLRIRELEWQPLLVQSIRPWTLFSTMKQINKWSWVSAVRLANHLILMLAASAFVDTTTPLRSPSSLIVGTLSAKAVYRRATQLLVTSAHRAVADMATSKTFMPTLLSWTYSLRTIENLCKLIQHYIKMSLITLSQKTTLTLKTSLT